MLDHLVYAAPDVEAAAHDLAARLGVEPGPGGVHQGFSTRNRLLRIAPDAYLEIVGPDPDQPAPDGPRWFGIDDLTEPRLVTWAVAVPDPAARADRLRVAGWDPGPLVDMARTAAATGARVAWQLTLPPSDRPRPVDGIAPFLIRWANDAPHPAGSAPGGCAIRSLRAEHPQPDDARRALDALGVHLPVARGDAPALIAHIDAPRGSIFLR